jgi:quinolinate synthase
MISRAKQDPANEFIVVTEQGMVERLKLEIPEKKFYMIVATCIQMKKNTLEKVLKSLQEEIHPINLDEEIMKRARLALQRMLDISKKSD